MVKRWEELDIKSNDSTITLFEPSSTYDVREIEACIDSGCEGDWSGALQEIPQLNYSL